jgi:glutathione S-transferase
VWVESEIRTNHGTNAATAGAQDTVELPKGVHEIQLHSMSTPNGVKATIMLEEVCAAVPSFDYDAYFVSIGGHQFDSGFVGINPNSKIPAMIDYGKKDEKGNPVRIFESGSILIYLAEKYPQTKLLPPAGDPQRTEVLNWVFWAMASPPFLGGGFGHFFSKRDNKNESCPVEHLEYPLNRYTQEAKRQCHVLELLLSDGRTYICGENYSIADIAIWPWSAFLDSHVSLSLSNPACSSAPGTATSCWVGSTAEWRATPSFRCQSTQISGSGPKTLRIPRKNPPRIVLLPAALPGGPDPP